MGLAVPGRCASPGAVVSMARRTVRAEQVNATREAILTAAERLFAEHGVYAVSNRQVSEAAGQGNNAAVGYHFGTKADLVRAVARRHAERIETLRERALAAAAGSTDMRDWVDCLVRPVTEHLAGLGDPTWYARFCAQVMTNPAMHQIMVEESLASPALRAGRRGAEPHPVRPARGGARRARADGPHPDPAHQRRTRACPGRGHPHAARHLERGRHGPGRRHQRPVAGPGHRPPLTPARGVGLVAPPGRPARPGVPGRPRHRSTGGRQSRVVAMLSVFAATTAPMAAHSGPPRDWPSTNQPTTAASTGLTLMKSPKVCAGTRRRVSRSAR